MRTTACNKPAFLPRLIMTALAIILPVSLLYAQLPHFRKHTLPQEQINTGVTLIYQDKARFLWLGTTNGLSRFNGMDHLHLVQDTTGENKVTALFEDSQGRLWTGYKSGKIGIVKDDRFIEFAPEEGFPKVPITGFTEDRSKALWFSTYGEGLYCLKNGRMYNIGQDDGLTDNFVYDIVLAKDGKVWAATDGGISICAFEGNKKSIQKLDVASSNLPDNIVTKLFCDAQGNVWAGTESRGACRFNTQLGKFDMIHDGAWNRGAVTSLYVFDDNAWVGTQSGIFEMPLSTGNYASLTGPSSSLQGRITGMTTDTEGNVWVANGSPVFYTTNRAFRFITSAAGMNVQNVQALLRDRRGRTWFSTKEAVMVYSNGEKNGSIHTWTPAGKPGHQPVNVISMYEDAFGYIWLGTFGDGIYRVHEETGKVQQLTEANGLVNNNVLSIAGNEKEVWLATLGGASKCTIGNNELKFTNYTAGNGLSTNYIYKVFFDSRERVWFATDGKGLTVMENGIFRNYSTKDGLKSNTIYSVTEDSFGNIWFSTSNAGIYKFDGKVFKHFSLNNGLRELAITSLVADNSGNVLIVSRQGIDVLNVKTENIFYHGDELGITDIDPDLNSTFTDKEGNIWLGTRNSIIKYTPGKTQEQHWPIVRINKLLVFLEEPEPGHENKFDHDRNHISFDYIGFWYHDPQEVTYRVKLEGYDREWLISKNRFVTYPNLPPGKYTFHVQASATGKFEGAETSSYSFKISPPFYNTVWFYILCALAGGGLLYLYIKSRERKLKAAERIKKDKVEFQFETLKSQVNPHFLFNSFNTLIAVIEEDKDTAVEYVEKLSDFYRNILLQREKDVIPLGEELEMLDDYYFLQQKRYRNNFLLNINVPPEMRKASIAPLTLQLLVENAVKHNVISREKPLVVNIFTENGYIVVENNLQRKQQAEPSTGVGLNNIVSRYRLLTDKEVRIHQTASHYIVTIPLLNQER